MKKFLLATLCILIGVLAFAQAPQKISYQAVIRNNNGNLVTNQQVSLRISIMKNGGTTGQIDQPIVNRSIAAIYTETHTVTTNANGLATIEIGGGVTSDNFATIDWSNGTYYLKTSVDLTGRGRYEVMGMSQLISVPYAMYAQKAGSAVYETDPQFNAWDKDYNDLTNRPEIPVVPTNVSAFENDAQYITSADVPAQVNADWNATSGVEQIMNKPEIPTVPTNVSAFENDANYITSADVPAQVNADWNATSGAGQILNKPAIPTVPTTVSAFTNDANYITSADVPAQVNADWNATSGAGQILNKPEIPTVPTNVSAFANDANYITSADVPAQVNADWNATSGAGQILNKPAIPTVPTNLSAFANDANYITSADVPAQVNADWNATSGAGQILNKPELFSGNYNDLTNKPEIPTVPTNVSAFTNDANYITSADVPAQVNADWNATSGAGQILNKPAIPTVPTNVSAFTNDANYITSADVPVQVNADWNATSGAGQILNKPEIFSGNYNDLTNRPEIPIVPTNVSAFANDANYITSADVPAQVNADWNATSGAGQILNKPEIPTVPTNVSAFTNDANYITSADVPAQVNADWNATSGTGQILNKPELFSGNYNDLTNKPAIPTVPTNVSAFTNDANYITSADVPAQVNADWNATSGAGQILNKPELFSGNYNDLTNKPEIPTVPTNVSAFTNDANYITSADVPAQVNADWNATSGAGQILNKPEIPTVPTNVSAFTNDANYITSADVPAQVNADWNATSGAGQILNKPAIPTVPTNVSAFTNDANYITSADVPAQVNADWNATSGAGQILNKPELFSGNYNDLTNKPAIPTVPTNVSAFTNDANYITSADVPAQVNADWNASSGAGQILNKPEIPTVPTNVSAFTNDANYITSADVPAQVNADWNATSGAGQILNKPEIPTVPTNVSAFTNDANYITSADVPAQVNADWNATSGAGQILNKPELFSGDYNDLTNKPAIPTVPTNVSAFTNDANYITSADVPAQVNADWNATSGAGQILNKPELFSGNYNDLTNKPAIPTVPINVSAFTNDANYITSADVPAQVNADWNATSGAGQILNKPAIPTVPTNVSAFANDANYITSADVPAQVNADWNATSGAGQILNKPELFDGNYNNLTNTPDLSGYITTETQTLADVVALSNSAGDRQIKNIADPTEDQDAVTKKYVDELIAALQVQNAELQALQATIESLQDRIYGRGSFIDDRDNNVYATVTIGQQVWMAENLRYAKGSRVPIETTSETIAYHYYPNGGDQSNVSTYGYLYNWTAAKTACPTGWRLPSKADWIQLTDYLSSTNVFQCGYPSTNIAKSLASTTEWLNSTNTCAVGNSPADNNSTGFNALPVTTNGNRSSTSFWTATVGNVSSTAWSFGLHYLNATVTSSGNSSTVNRFSVRCVKN